MPEQIITTSAPGAVRTVSETDEVHVIEGLGVPFGGPFGGKDLYGTTFTARTDLALDLHPGGVPVLYQHGFDDEIGLAPVGRVASYRTTPEGVWVRAQLDKRAAYYTRIRALLEQDALGFSAGSAEHSVRWDEGSGEILVWPLHEISLTPTPANPLAVIAARSAEVAQFLAIAAGEEPPPATRDAFDAATGADVLACVLRLMAVEQAEGDTADAAILQRAVDALTEFIGTESTESEPAMVEPMSEPAMMTAARAGARNSAADAALLTTAHDAIASVLSMPCAPSDGPAAAMSSETADPQPAVLAVRGDVIDLAHRLDEVAERTVRRLLG